MAKYNIPDNKQVKIWLVAFQRLGIKESSRSRKKKNYSFQFKLHATELHPSTEVFYKIVLYRVFRLKK